MKNFIEQELRDFTIKAPKVFQAFLQKKMKAGNFSSASEVSYSGSKLRVKSGALQRSFQPKDPNSYSDIFVRKGKLNIILGSKLIYAAVHEYGMFIKSKGKMAKWMWYQFIKTKNPLWKKTALSVEEKGGVRIKKRPYFEPAVERFQKWFLNEADNILNRIVKKYEQV